VLVENGRLERKRDSVKGAGSHLYRGVETRHGLAKAPDQDCPTECQLHLE
jgi:hypothetical protein